MLDHDGIISKLEKRLLENGYVTHSCEEYRYKKSHGEIDLYGVSERDKTVLSIEVKTTDKIKNRKKAKEQIERGFKYLNSIYPDMKLIGFYAHGNRSSKGYDIKKIKTYLPKDL